ncbi:hypothetical protein [Microbacterium sp. 18062]|uniref:hypothetical protein n=1 Tax=Microbacterium sp. 18062 TaxID=2681410 RepID=UPI00135B2FA3|nr:hypothetical protein [Microbacterium sp. 18062]
MKAWIVRFVSLYVFDLVVLLLIGLLLSSVRVGLAAFWAALVLTAATIWLKPLVRTLFRKFAARSASTRTRLSEKLVQGVLVFVVELIVWIAVVVFSGVDVRGWFWGWVLPPIALLIAFAIYDLVDDRIEARAGSIYDRVTRHGGAAASVTGEGTATRGDVPPVPRAPGASPDGAPARDRHDGLTAEQRRMLDELG